MSESSPTHSPRSHATRLAASAVAIAGLSALLGTCKLATADFSAYTNTNLIPEAQLDSWKADQDLSAAPGNQYMTFERLDTAAAGQFAATTGFADAAALYDTLPASANATDGSRPPIYRQEIRNLFKDGDFEASTPGTSTQTGPGDPTQYYEIPGNPGRFIGNNSADVALRVRSILAAGDAANHMTTGQALSIQQGRQDWTRVDLSQNLTVWAPAGANYNLGFRVYLVTTLDFYLGLGSNTEDFVFLHVYGNTQNVVRRFPQEMTDGTTTGSTSIFYATAERKYLYINPLTEKQVPINNSEYDDFRVVRTDRSYAVRYEIPKQTGANLALAQGGTYTFTIWVRNDPTAVTGNANKSPNRYPAEKISLSVMDEVGNNTFPWNNRVLFNAPATGDWTQLSASFTGMLANSSEFYTAMDTDKLLQLTITPTDTISDATQFPGSILLASPRLTFSPD